MIRLSWRWGNNLLMEWSGNPPYGSLDAVLLSPVPLRCKIPCGCSAVLPPTSLSHPTSSHSPWRSKHFIIRKTPLQLLSLPSDFYGINDTSRRGLFLHCCLTHCTAGRGSRCADGSWDRWVRPLSLVMDDVVSMSLMWENTTYWGRDKCP